MSDLGPNMIYIGLVPNAMRGMCNAFTQNEAKHGVGVNIKSVNYELSKSIGHIISHFTDPNNSEDGCLHLESAISRLAKALESYAEDEIVNADREGAAIAKFAKDIS